MKVGSVDRSKAQKQWRSLVKALRSAGIKVNAIKQKKGLPDMVFAADQGFVNKKDVVLSNFRYRQRQGETKYYQDWFEAKGFTIKTLPKNYFFEGSGECVRAGKTFLVGTGFRNSPGVCKFLSKFLDVEAVCLELVSPKFYHLDTCLFALNDFVAFYYPFAFSPASRKILKSMFKQLIPLKRNEAESFAANSLVTDHHVVTQSGNSHFKKQVESFGYKVLEADVSEFLKSGGGIHCLVQTLEERYE
ncbi:hypothetical protein HYT59_00235 [Candidatus Woesebacteria bacterium]|nr:hypothetical protein [Candidatus Woesebacteria bacterium]